MLKKIRFYARTFFAACSAGAFLTLLDFLVYRTPLRIWWARLKGHRFHRSSLFWFKEGDGVHTRALFLLPRLKAHYPDLKTISMDLSFYDQGGNLVLHHELKDVDVTRFFVLESKDLPQNFRIPAPFDGTLIVKQKLDLDDKSVLVKQEGLFASTHTYLDYYSEGSFVTTLHDYSAYLPDQGINVVSLGMIVAYCDKDRETFLIFHAVKPGVGPRDLKVILLNHRGEKRSAWFSGLRPFAMRKILLTELFPDAESFLQGQVGQVRIEGFLRQLLRRTAFGVQDRKSPVFSLDHCFYSAFESKPAPISAADRLKMPKGAFSPLLVFETDKVATAAIIYQNQNEPERIMDVLIYDAEGKCVVRSPQAIRLKGDRVIRIAARKILEDHHISLPFVGKMELVYHDDGKTPLHQIWLEHHAEYDTQGKTAHVIHGTDYWNGPEAVANPRYQSSNRIVCDEAQTTFLAISNCSYDYNYKLEVTFRLNLMASDGRIVASEIFKIGPDATLFKPIEEFFPNAQRLLAPTGVGVTVTTDINCDCLTHAFLTQDRRSGVLSVEHSLSMV